MENPYASPTVSTRPEGASGWVFQARVVAALLLIQGLFECAIGLLLVYQWEKLALTVAVVSLVFLLAILKIVAGIRNFEYRNRGLGLVALGVAPLALFTCFGFPSALAIMVYGLVVYLHRDVRDAFRRTTGKPR